MDDELTYIDANTLLLESFELAKKIWNSGYRPDFLVGIWRGGTPPGVAIHEFFRYKGHDPYHTAIKTQSYTGLQSTGKVSIKGIEHIVDVVNSEDQMLIVDDVFDTGLTMKAVVDTFKSKARKNCPLIKTATVYYKPEKRKVEMEPDYYLKVDNRWLIFPHELESLTTEQIRRKGPEISKVVLDE